MLKNNQKRKIRRKIFNSIIKLLQNRIYLEPLKENQGKYDGKPL